MNARWFAAPLIIVVIIIAWQILTAGNSFTQLDGEDAWQLWSGRDPLLVLDASERRLFDQGHIPGAVHVEVGDVREFARTLDREQPVLVVSTRGSRSLAVANLLILSRLNRVYHLQGGLDRWPGPIEQAPR